MEKTTTNSCTMTPNPSQGSTGRPIVNICRGLKLASIGILATISGVSASFCAIDKRDLACRVVRPGKFLSQYGAGILVEGGESAADMEFCSRYANTFHSILKYEKLPNGMGFVNQISEEEVSQMISAKGQYDQMVAEAGGEHFFADNGFLLARPAHDVTDPDCKLLTLIDRNQVPGCAKAISKIGKISLPSLFTRKGFLKMNKLVLADLVEGESRYRKASDGPSLIFKDDGTDMDRSPEGLASLALDRGASKTEAVTIYQYFTDPGKMNKRVRRLLNKYIAAVGPSSKKARKMLNTFAVNLQKKIENLSTKDSYYETAAYAHLELVRIHPFVDGNGRSSRLLMNRILEEGGYGPVFFLSNDLYTQKIDDALKLRRKDPDNYHKPFASYLQQTEKENNEKFDCSKEFREIRVS